MRGSRARPTMWCHAFDTQIGGDGEQWFFALILPHGSIIVGMFGADLVVQLLSSAGSRFVKH